MDACAVSGKGIKFGLVGSALSAAEAVSLQALIKTQVDNLFDGAAAGGTYAEVFTLTGAQTTTLAGPTADATKVHLCIGP